MMASIYYRCRYDITMTYLEMVNGWMIPCSRSAPGATALEVQRTYRLADGRIAQVAINTHPASRFRHSMTMRRVKG